MPEKSINDHQPSATSDSEVIKVVDRQGKVKVIPKSEYDQKRRRRKKREHRKTLPYREVVSVVFIVIVMALAVYLAFHFVK